MVSGSMRTSSDEKYRSGMSPTVRFSMGSLPFMLEDLPFLRSIRIKSRQVLIQDAQMRVYHSE